VKLEFDGVRVEVGDTSSGPRYFDRERSDWVDQVMDFGSSESMEVLGVTVNVMPVDHLVAYKTALGRPVDLQDIDELSAR